MELGNSSALDTGFCESAEDSSSIVVLLFVHTALVQKERTQDFRFLVTSVFRTKLLL